MTTVVMMMMMTVVMMMTSLAALPFQGRARSTVVKYSDDD